MRRLGALPHARVYLDAGNPGMFADPSRLAGPLEAAGLRYGRGFSANVSNFEWTADVVAWSQQLERALGGTVGAVIDTSRNGRGPYTGPDAPQWCNPPGRALGPTPQAHPGPAGIDAYLWIKDPGASDGSVPGGRRPGRYWPAYAAALASRAGPGAATHAVRVRVTRRGIQITLGLLWLLDGALQFQPAMLTSAFAPAGDRARRARASRGSSPGRCTRRPASSRTPGRRGLIFGLIQLALGAGLLHRRTARWALAASVGWALAVWYLGEGLGGLFGGGDSLLTGAPGSALMYAVVAVTVWPRRGPSGATGSPEPGRRPARWAAVAWAATWLGGAVLQLLPGSDTNASVVRVLSMNASGAPGWLAAWTTTWPRRCPAAASRSSSTWCSCRPPSALGVLAGRRTRRAAVWTGIGLVAGLLGDRPGPRPVLVGTATDPDTAPLVILLGVTVLGAAPCRPARRDPRLAPASRQPAAVLAGARPAPGRAAGRLSRAGTRGPGLHDGEGGGGHRRPCPAGSRPPGWRRPARRCRAAPAPAGRARRPGWPRCAAAPAGPAASGRPRRSRPSPGPAADRSARAGPGAARSARGTRPACRSTARGRAAPSPAWSAGRSPRPAGRARRLRPSRARRTRPCAPRRPPSPARARCGR